MTFLAGTEVQARGLRWEVIEAIPVGSMTRLRLRGVGGIFTGKEVHLLHPFEQVVEITREMSPSTPTILPNWRVYHQAFLLEQAFGPDAFVAVQPGRLRIEPYQLVPVSRALRMSRPRLLLADDVGLGKTIEAGLIVAELIARRRVHRVLVVTPAGPLLDQWREELSERFGLRLTPVDRAELDRIRQASDLGANPFDSLPLAIASMDFLKQERVLDQLERTCYDLVIVDECHHYFGGDAASDDWSDDSQRRKLGEVLAQIADAFLMLSATPHDGRDRSLGSLLELLDPSLVDGKGLPRGNSYHLHLVRRLKEHVKVYNPLTGQREPFKKREVLPIPVQAHADPNSPFHALHWNLLEMVGPELRKAVAKKQYDEALTFTSLLKRSASTVSALLKTLTKIRNRHAELLSQKQEQAESKKGRLRNLRALKRKIDRFGSLSLEEEQEYNALEVEEIAQQLSFMEKGTRADGREVKRAESITTILARLTDLAEKAVGTDPKLDRLLTEIKQIRAEEPEANIIVYTEYVDSLNAIMERLDAAGLKALSIHGEDDDDTRKDKTRQFKTNNNLVLVSTDASAEGLNLHQRCHHLIHLELPWNPNRIEQRNGRIDRYGQYLQPMIRYLYLVGTFEERIMARLAAKHENQLRLLKFMPNTLGDLPESVLYPILANSKLDLASKKKPYLFETEETPDDPDVKALLDEVDKALSKFISAAKTVTWFSHGMYADDGAREAAEKALDVGRRTGEVDLLDFVTGAIKLEDGSAVDRNGYVELHLPPHWLGDIESLPGFDKSMSGVLRVTPDIDRLEDEKKRPLGHIGRAHPIVQRAIERVRHLALGQQGGDDVRVSVARAKDGKDAIIATYVGRILSGEGRELERVIAVRIHKGEKPEVVENVTDWLPEFDAVVPQYTKMWETRFKSWGADASRDAHEPARTCFEVIADAFIKQHTALLESERAELEIWFATRVEEMMGKADVQQDLFASVKSDAPTGPMERLRELIAHERASKRRVEAETVRRTYESRLKAIAARSDLKTPEVYPIGMLLLVGH